VSNSEPARYISDNECAFDLYLDPRYGKWWISAEEVRSEPALVWYGIWHRWPVQQSVSVTAADALLHSESAKTLLARVAAGFDWDYDNNANPYGLSYTDDAKLAVSLLTELAADAGIINQQEWAE
jgi:hypothetical protein